MRSHLSSDALARPHTAMRPGVAQSHFTSQREKQAIAVDLPIWIARQLLQGIERRRQHVLWEDRRQLFANRCRSHLLSLRLKEERYFLSACVVQDAGIGDSLHTQRSMLNL